MSETEIQETDQSAPVTSAIPRWTPDFDIEAFDLPAAFREAQAQRKSVGKLLKALGYPVAKFIATDVPAFKSADGIPVTASTTAVDLAGDDFDLEALRQMKEAALGSTVFLNHAYEVPEDVYGKVASADVERRSVFNPLTGQNANHWCLDLDVTPVGEEENPRAVRVTNMLRKSQLKLGVSVTVLVLAYRERKDGGRTITMVYYLESSMVGIPCNQTAWAHDGVTKTQPPATASTASKSLTTMPEQKSNTAADAASDNTPRVTFAQALATMKSMFADVLHENQNNFWLYVDSLRTVYRQLISEARGKSGDAVTALIEEGNTSVDDFAAELKTLLAAEIAEAATQEATAGCYYEYWSAIGRLQGVVQKAGARNSQADQGLLNKAHDCLVEAGAQCAHETNGAVVEGEAKLASLPGAPNLQTKVAALEAEKATLSEQLEAALQTAEELSKQLELEQATSATAVEALEAMSREPLPRAGA